MARASKKGLTLIIKPHGGKRVTKSAKNSARRYGARRSRKARM